MIDCSVVYEPYNHGEEDIHCSFQYEHTRVTVFFLRRLTIGLTPVSLGNNLTKEKPSFRCRKISAASAYLIIKNIQCSSFKNVTYIRQFFESDRGEARNERCTQCCPIVMSKIEYFISEGRRFCYIESGLLNS